MNRTILALSFLALLAGCGGGGHGGGAGPGGPTYSLTVTVGPPAGGGTITPASGSYTAGTVVTLTAHPDPGYGVASWSGTDNDVSQANVNTVTISGSGPQQVSVVFMLAGPG